KLRCLCTVHLCIGTLSQTAAIAVSRPRAPSTIRNSGRWRPRLMRSSRTARQASVLSPPMFLTCEQHLLAVRAHADDDKQRDRRSLAIEPDANDGAVE